MAEMSADKFKEILRHVQFKGWSFIVKQDGARCYMQVAFSENHSETGEPAYWTGRKWMLSDHMTDSEVVQTAFLGVMTAVEHETREAFTFCGAAIFGPHFDVDLLVDLAKANSLDVRAAPPPKTESGA